MDYEGNYKNRKKRPRYILYLVVFVPLVIISVLLWRRSPSSDDPHSTLQVPIALSYSALEYRNRSVTLDAVLAGRYYARGFNGSFVDGDTLQFFSANGDLVLYSIEAGNTSVVISSQEFVEKLSHVPYRCVFSPSKNYILVSYDPQKVYRHSVFALYDVFDIKSRTFIPITTDKFSKEERTRRIQLAKWSETKDSLIFVHANDIYFLKSLNGRAERVTKDGSHVIYNGVTDWVYEEEMFSSNEAMWLKDDENLAFVTFNDSMVDSIQFPVYGRWQYPILEAIPYPKTGRPNPTAIVSMYSGSQKSVQHINLPSYIPQEHYIAQVKWTAKTQLLVQIFNRYQNNSWILLCDLTSNCEVVHTQEQSNGWLDNKEIFDVGDGEHFVTSESAKQEKESFHHLVEFNTESVVQVRSKGDFNVDKILVASKEAIYYTANDNLHKLTSTSRTSRSASNSCVTCGLKCKTNDITMHSSNGKYFIHTCLNGLDDVPLVSIYQTEPLKRLAILESNSRLKQGISTLQLPITKELSFKTDSGFTAKIKLFLPYDFDEGKKYPILIDVYGGPGSTRINSKFQIDWGTSLVSSKNIIYGSIDGRGSGGQSDDFMFQVYKKLGTVEVKDQIDGAAYLVKTLPYIDPNKVAIWGWSYGGYISAMVMGTDLEQVFKCGISVAPVTNWMFYDTIYTERYMGLPFENSAAYNASDVTNHLDNFENKNFLLVHGNADDNVHYQQSMYFSRALELNDILFYQQSYPDENHGLGSVRPHLYHTLERFLFNQCF